MQEQRNIMSWCLLLASLWVGILAQPVVFGGTVIKFVKSVSTGAHSEFVVCLFCTCFPTLVCTQAVDAQVCCIIHIRIHVSILSIRSIQYIDLYIQRRFT
jgi:hypothetical protein